MQKEVQADSRMAAILFACLQESGEYSPLQSEGDKMIQETLECPKCQRVVSIEPEMQAGANSVCGHGTISYMKKPNELQCACGFYLQREHLAKETSNAH